MKVSVVTISQEKRFPMLCLLARCIHAQELLPDEWVIVEGSPNELSAQHNELFISNLSKSKDLKVPITYLPYIPGQKLGALRNRGNRACTGDITVCMDDDDYYPPQRIKHVVERFKGMPNYLIAGCSDIFIHDYTTLQFYQCKQFHPYHSTNSAMAWRKEYLITHEHDETRHTGEEASFTNNFTEPMIALNPQFTVLLSSHSKNTFDKRDMLKNNPRFTPLSFYVMPKLIPQNLYQEYYHAFKREE
jgi:glycosyltransferase involved in cell wall biosynthesis